MFAGRGKARQSRQAATGQGEVATRSEKSPRRQAGTFRHVLSSECAPSPKRFSSGGPRLSRGRRQTPILSLFIPDLDEPSQSPETVSLPHHSRLFVTYTVSCSMDVCACIARLSNLIPSHRWLRRYFCRISTLFSRTFFSESNLRLERFRSDGLPLSLHGRSRRSRTFARRNCRELNQPSVAQVDWDRTSAVSIAELLMGRPRRCRI